MRLAKSPQRLLAFEAEFARARSLYQQGELGRSFFHAERAHILGQPWMGRHTAAHWLMLKIGVRRRDAREIWGQIIRIAGGGVLSLVGKLPHGNTGGANVAADKPMPLPEDLKHLCEP